MLPPRVKRVSLLAENTSWAFSRGRVAPRRNRVRGESFSDLSEGRNRPHYALDRRGDLRHSTREYCSR